MTSEEQYFAGDDLALHAWQSKYRLGNESLDEFFERIAREFARLDNFPKERNELTDAEFEGLSDYGKTRIGIDRYQRFLYLFQDFKGIIPGGSVLAGIGSNKPVSLSNCFVVPTDDSIERIFNTGHEMAEIYKRRGGVGVDLSILRPAKALVNNAAKTTSGVTAFMELFSQVTNTIGQEGRRGALMLSIDINHPDSPEFVKIKQDLTKVTGANVSVKLNGEFMKAVENDTDYLLCWPTDYNCQEVLDKEIDLPYDHLFPLLVNNEVAAYVKKIRAKELWESIIHCAWSTAEPGILFWDNIIDNDPASVYPEFQAISTNPCGEIPLSAYDSCRLIASNLYGIVEYPFTEDARINEDLAYKVFYEAQIIGDILVDLELEAISKIIDMTSNREQELWKKVYEIGKQGRRTGVGITALADMLAALGTSYVSPKLIENIMNLKMTAELDATIDLAIINGPFPAYNKDLEYGDGGGSIVPGPDYFGRNTFYDNLMFNFPTQWEKMNTWGRRNISWSTIAPTGTISIMAGTSSGCEPVFSIYYTRRKKCNPGEVADFTDQNGIGFKNYNVIHGKFKDWFHSNTGESPTELETMTKAELDSIIKMSPWYGSTAEEISPADRVQVQATLQKYTTHSISSTVNVAKTATEEDIATIYNDAHSSGCKGITVYRDGSRSGILIKEETAKMSESRPDELDCKVLRFKNEDKKNWISFVGIYNTQAYEIFTGINDLDELPIPSYIDNGKIIKVSLPEGSRYDFSYLDKYGYVNTVGGLNRVFNKEYWNYARFVSALLREGTPIDKVIKVVDGLTFTNKGMNSFQAGLIRSLKLFVPDGTEAHGAICENCGGHNIIYEGGCMICRDCGSSKCG